MLDRHRIKGFVKVCGYEDEWTVVFLGMLSNIKDCTASFKDPTTTSETELLGLLDVAHAALHAVG